MALLGANNASWDSGDGTADAAPDAGQVVGKVLEVYGGVEAIRAVTSHRQEGMLVAVRGGGHGRLYRISDGPDRLSILVSYPDRNELRILSNGSAWRGPDASSLAEVGGPLKGAMVLQAARSWLPRLLDDHRDDVVLAGTADGRTALDVRIADDLVLRVIVEDSTGLIVRSESILRSAPGPVGFATDYSDFRMVSGVLFAFREETYASGYHTGSAVLESVELNPQGAQARLPVPKVP
ncbi:MAG TPA: hypothetical protein VLA36_05725 [Longimicrobiales bacterium]|nr:hypothetical protein [Longimicrobiales bacterium]